MTMESIRIKPDIYPVRDVLDILLLDRTTETNIIFATESYECNADAGAKNPITKDFLQGPVCLLQPHILKDAEEQVARTRKKAEVFTPAWVCCMMNDYCDKDWFGYDDVFFNRKDREWTPIKERIIFSPTKTWQEYVDSRRLEISCGEAPYLVSRYDMETGQMIDIGDRVGMLDRKLRIVNENTETEAEWLKWTKRAFQSVYGYEYQGDNLLIARINLLLTFVEYMQDRWRKRPPREKLEEITHIISCNIWQMDGLTGTIPMHALKQKQHQIDLFENSESYPSKIDNLNECISCRLYDWRGTNEGIEFLNLKEKGRHMKFDYIIGNPPYQKDTEGTSDSPIYNYFMDAAYEIADKVELITPARFLFDAGKTPKAWNKKMLEDKHLKILKHDPDSRNVFPTTNFRGGGGSSYLQGRQ